MLVPQFKIHTKKKKFCMMTNLTNKNKDISFKTSVHIVTPCQFKADMCQYSSQQ